MEPSIESSDIVTLYGLEAGLIQQKASHILAIRTLAITVFAAIIGTTVFYPRLETQYLSMALIPLFLLDAVYDGYLIPIVRRETQLRLELARRMQADGLDSSLVSAYMLGPDHRFSPSGWTPFRQAIGEPIRIILYAALILGPILVAQFSSAFA